MCPILFSYFQTLEKLLQTFADMFFFKTIQSRHTCKHLNVPMTQNTQAPYKQLCWQSIKKDKHWILFRNSKQPGCDVFAVDGLAGAGLLELEGRAAPQLRVVEGGASAASWTGGAGCSATACSRGAGGAATACCGGAGRSAASWAGGGGLARNCLHWGLRRGRSFLYMCRATNDSFLMTILADRLVTGPGNVSLHLRVRPGKRSL